MTNKRGQIYESNIRHAYPFLRRTQSPQSGSFIFKMAVMLQIPQVFPRVSCLRSAKAVQCPYPGPQIGDKSYQIPRYSPVCPWGQPPGMAADKCIIPTQLFRHASASWKLANGSIIFVKNRCNTICNTTAFSGF